MSQRKWTVEQKLEIVLAALKAEESISQLCRRHGVSETALYRWRELFLEAGRSGLANGKGRASSKELQLERENEELKKTVGELTMANRLLKKLQ